MYFGLIDEHSRQHYTYLKDIFTALNNRQKEYNWLITDCEIIAHSDALEELNAGDYHFFSGDELTELVEKDDSQWIWGVLSGFDKNIPLNKIMQYPLPKSDSHGFRKNPVILQHPLSSVEIVPFDSSFVLIISTQKDCIESFRKAFPKCEDLFDYNNRA